MLIKAIEYETEKVVTTTLGDLVYMVKLKGEKVGALVVTPLEGQVIVRGAVMQPSPVLIKGKIGLEGRTVDEVIGRGISDLVKTGENVEAEEAEKAIREIDKLVEKEQGKEG